MNDRATLGLVAVAIALALGVIFLEHEVSTVPTVSPERFRVFRGLKPENVDRIVLLGRRNTVYLIRGGSRWFFKRPLQGSGGYEVEWEADPDAVNRIVDLLVELREAAPAVEGRPGHPLDLVQYQLQNPQEHIEVVYGSEYGTRTARLHLGGPAGSGRIYARLNEEDRVLVVDDALLQVMQLVHEGGTAFRSRKVFPREDLAEATAVYLQTGSYQAQLDRITKDVWQIRWRPEKVRRTYTARAARDKVKKIATALQELRVERFVADTADNQELGRYGLLEPRAVVRCTLPEASTGILALFSAPEKMDLRIGAAVPDRPDEVYALALRLPCVFTVKKSLLAKLPEDPKEFVAKRLAYFEGNKVAALTLTNAHGTLRAEKKDYDWYVKAPLEIGGEYTALNALVDAVTATDCEDFLWPGTDGTPNTGLDTPPATLTVKYEVEEDGKKTRRVEKFQIGKVFEKEVARKEEEKADGNEKNKEDKEKKAGKEKKKFVYARRVGDVAVRIFPWDRFQKFFAAPLSFYKRRVLEFDSWNATKLRIFRPGEEFTFEKKEDDWFMTRPVSLKADAGNVAGLVSSLSWLNAEKIVSQDPEERARYGLDKPTYRIEVDVKQEKKEKGKEGKAGASGTETSGGKKAEKKPAQAATKGEADQEKKGKSEGGKKKEKKEVVKTYVLLVTKKKEGEKDVLYGYVPGQPLLFTLEASWQEKLDGEVADTDLFGYEWKMREAVVEHAGKVVRLTRDADGKVFQVAAGKEGKPEKAAEEPTRKFFEKLGAVKTAGRYVTYDAKDLSPYGLAKDLYAKITVKDKDEKVYTVEVGGVADKEKHGEGLRYARRSGQSAVFLLKETDLAELLKPADHFRPKKEKKKAEKKEGGKPAQGASGGKGGGAPSPGAPAKKGTPPQPSKEERSGAKKEGAPKKSTAKGQEP